ncbi:hypothetical protein SRHO_G00152920 [Serrasalmus rhombeus]
MSRLTISLRDKIKYHNFEDSRELIWKSSEDPDIESAEQSSVSVEKSLCSSQAEVKVEVDQPGGLGFVF